MRLRRLGLTLCATLVLGALAANVATATPVESAGTWSAGGVALKEPVGVLCDYPVREEGGGGTFVTNFGTATMELEMAGLSCSESTIYNESSKAKAKVTLKYTGVTVVKPAGCTVSGGAFATEALAGQVVMEGSKALLRYSPASGSTFATFKVTGCTLAGSYSVKGSTYGEMVSATGVAGTSQFIKFSSAINSAAGGSLTVNGNPVVVTEEQTLKLSKGGPYSVHE